MSGGNFRKSGTEWKRISGGCWAKRGTAAEKSRIGEELIGFDLREGNCFGERLSGFEFNGGILGIGDVDGDHRGGADGRFVIASFVNNEPRAGGHLGKVS